MKRILPGVISICVSLTALKAETFSLAGRWRFQIDRADVGIAERWYERSLTDKIKLPGSLTAQGVGDPITMDTKWTGSLDDKSLFTEPEYAPYRVPGHVKVPFWLQPDLYYVGAAWFQRDVEVPGKWSGKRVVLFLERAHWETRVWVDGKLIGTNNSLATPHEYDLGALPPGEHTLTIRVDNRLSPVDVGENSHSVTDHSQGNWNGIVGRIELRATSASWVEDLQAYPRVGDRTVLVKGRVGQLPGQSAVSKVALEVKPVSGRGKAITVSAPVSANSTFEATLALGDDAECWDESNPALYELVATVDASEKDLSSRAVRFGLREFAADGTQFVLNGRKTYIRGTLDCCVFPKTGHPPTDVESWKREIRIAKSFGLNQIRFHSWCPPEAAFVAADELGFYFRVECSSWANQSTTLGDGKPIDAWVYQEADRILQNYGNHPSFLLMTYGNEPGGKQHTNYLSKWVNHYRAQDSRRLYSGASGWGHIPEEEFVITSAPRIQGWGQGLKSRINARSPETTTDYRSSITNYPMPVICHEMGQWCVYPNFDEMPKYTGYLKPKNFEIFRDRIEANGMGGLAKQFLFASGKLQALCYKEDIEAALRTPGMGGFELLDLHDFPGQGTALVGVLDPFWSEKGYIGAKEYSRFCNAVVPLARLPKRVFTTDQTLTAQLEAANFSARPLENSVAEWKIVDDAGQIIARGKLPAKTLAVNNGQALGDIQVDLKNVKAPARLKLVVGLAGTKFENDWDIWVYPAAPAQPASDVLVTSKFDAAAQSVLQNGGKVLLTVPGKQVRNYDKKPVKAGFSSIFWNTAWTQRQPPTTLGILCDAKHPALAEFPTDAFSNWQWWYIIHRAGALRLDLLPKNLTPIVRMIDDWVTARPLGLVVEGKIGAGKIVICGFDLTDGALGDPVSRQMRASLVNYLNSNKCRPSVEFSPAQIGNLAIEPNTNKLQGVQSIKATSEQDGYEAQNAIDGDPQTQWHTSWGGDRVHAFPYELVIEFDAEKKLAGFTALPRQDGSRNGWIKDFEFYTSVDGKHWGEPAAKGTFTEDEKLKTIKFAAPVTAEYVKLVALSGFADNPWASLAEFNVIPANP